MESLAIYNKEYSRNTNRINLGDIELKLNLGLSISDFENFTYSEEIRNPTFDEEVESNFVFPVTTCYDRELFLLSDD